MGGSRIRFSRHAQVRIRERGIALTLIEDAIANGESFRYFHEGIWKDGYYESNSGVFVGMIDDLVTTVIKGASEGYIANLRAGAP